ncbi:hypothetical protein B9Z55_029079 [Caenorhabditis nigoni]|uniref:CCHC-type domain-containing protein n=1 Tax=Caenorhabditis nigoni TaxID=1611254 RepID=A0A2G5S8N6_9PELO|nr:hypothetical protein B9Z55_029079 [Caenorhabditis nigoni]
MPRPSKSATKRPPALKDRKSVCTRNLTSVRTTIALVERLLTRPMDHGVVVTLEGFQQDLMNKLVVLEDMPLKNEEFILNHPIIGANEALRTANRAEMETHLEARGFNALKDQVIFLIGEIQSTLEAVKLQRSLDQPSFRRQQEDDSSRVSISSKSDSEQSVPGKNDVKYSKKKNTDKHSKNREKNHSDHVKEPKLENPVRPPMIYVQREEQGCESEQSSNGPSSTSQNTAELVDGMVRGFNEVRNVQQLMAESIHLMSQKYDAMHKELMNSKKVSGDPKPIPKCEETGSPKNYASPTAEVPMVAADHLKIPSPSNGVSPTGSLHSVVTKDSPAMSPSPTLPTSLLNDLANTITPFSGNPEEYLIFKQTFDLLVHSNDSIPAVIKQTLLLRLLTGEARSMMMSSKISDQDYETLRSNLDRQYFRTEDNTRYYLGLLSKHAFHETDYEIMEKDLNRFCILTHTLRDLGCSVDDKLYFKQFISKLPEVIMGQVFKKERQGIQTFDELAKVAYATIAEKRALEEARDDKRRSVANDEIVSVNAIQAGGRGSKGTGSDHHQRPNGYVRRKICYFCNSEDHISTGCSLSLDDRVRKVKAKRLCFNCLSNDHIKENCMSQMTCYRCKGRHHTSLCRKNEPNAPAKTSTATEAKKAQFFRNKEAGTSESKSISDALQKLNLSTVVRDISDVPNPNCSDNSTEGSVRIECVSLADGIKGTTSTSKAYDQFSPVVPPSDSEVEVDKSNWEPGEEDIKEIYVSRTVDSEVSLPFMVLTTPAGHSVLALVDCGATTSIISTQAAVRFGLQSVYQRKLTFSGFVSESRVESCTFYRLELLDQNRKAWAATVASYSKMNIRFKAAKFNQEEIEHLESLGIDATSIMELEKHDGQPIDLILGNNILGNIVKEQFVLSTGRKVDRTLFGIVPFPPVVKGVLVPSGTSERICVLDTSDEVIIQAVDISEFDYPHQIAEGQTISGSKLDKQLEQSWNLEVIGMEPPSIVSNKQKLNDDLIDQFRNSTIRDENNLVYVSLPLNGQEVNLHNNYPIAERRLVSLLQNQLKTDKDKQVYDDIIRQQEKSGIIEKVTSDLEPGSFSYYIPHRAVFKSDSVNTKIRIVLDASSHMKKELSLNDCLHPGPSLLQPLYGIIIRSRLTRFIEICDIEKAFHQIRIRSEFRDLTRFLWIKDISCPPTGNNILIYRFTRLPFGVTSSPYLLSITIKTYLEDDPQPINARILENLYVDNILLSANEEEELLKDYKVLKEVFNKMHMNVREFLCNSETTMESIKVEDRAPNESSKLLGHIWNSKEDTIGVKIAVPPDGIPTKRQVVSFLAQTYDPTGIVTPLGIQTKTLISLLWKLDIKWNEPIPKELIPFWIEIKSNFTGTMLKVPRQLVSSYDYVNVRMIVFSDASKDHYGTAIYLRFEFPGPRFETQLIYSKSRIKPSNRDMTIPQMELIALECATNAAINIANEVHMELQSVVFFSDSTCVLYWVLHKISTHVALRWSANRVKEVRSNLKRLDELQLHPSLRYVNTHDNPADILTRGCTLDALHDKPEWFGGSNFLRLTEDKWPKNLDDTPADPREFRVFVINTGFSTQDGLKTDIEQPVQIKAVATRDDVYCSIVPYERTNSMRKLVSILCYVLEFVQQCIRKRNIRFPNHQLQIQSLVLNKFITAGVEKDEIAKRCISRNFVLQEHYTDASLRLNLNIPVRLEPVLLEDGLYHVRRPFANSSMQYHDDDIKKPIIIIHQHPVAKLIVTEIHEQLRHEGVKSVITKVQRKYWIEKLGVLARNIRSNCITCRKRHAHPYKYPYSKELPDIRTQMVTSFSIAGLDYFGPLLYKSKEGRGKVWVLLVTCLVTRAIHLEIVPDNTTFGFFD